MNLNRVILAGRVSQAPELRSTSSGQSVATMGVATNRIWADREGKKHEETQFHAIVIWGKLAETASAFLQKGTTVLVEGRIETRSYDDKDGVARKVTEIIAEKIEFGARPTPTAPAPQKAAPQRTAPASDDVRVVNLDGDEEDTGRDFSPMFHTPKADNELPPF